MFLLVTIQRNDEESVEAINSTQIVTIQPNTKTGMGSVVHLQNGKFAFCDETVKELVSKLNKE